MAKTRRSTIPRTRCPAFFSQRLPAMMTVNVIKIAIHIPILNEDTDPFARPRKKKIKMMVLISASNPQKVQKKRSFKSISSSIKRKSSYPQERPMPLTEGIREIVIFSNVFIIGHDPLKILQSSQNHQPALSLIR